MYDILYDKSMDFAIMITVSINTRGLGAFLTKYMYDKYIYIHYIYYIIAHICLLKMHPIPEN